MNSQVDGNFKWYQKIDDTQGLQQGDFIYGCQIVHPSSEPIKENQTISAEIAEYDVVVMSQSCDLVAEKINLVLVCPFSTLTELGEAYSSYKSKDMKNKLREGQVVGYHLLNESQDDGIKDFLVVDFKSVYAVPLPYLKDIALAQSNRIRLLPPYREHLSQSFARFFMRVGLPVDIPAFE